MFNAIALVMVILIIAVFFLAVFELAIARPNKFSGKEVFHFGEKWDFPPQLFSAVDEPSIRHAHYTQPGDFQDTNGDLIGGIQSAKW